MKLPVSSLNLKINMRDIVVISNESLARLRSTLNKVVSLLEEVVPAIKEAISVIDSMLIKDSFISADSYSLQQDHYSPEEESSLTEEVSAKEVPEDENITSETQPAVEMPIFSKKLGMKIANIIANNNIRIILLGSGLPIQNKVTRFLVRKLKEFEKILGGKMVVVPEDGMVSEIRYEGCRSPTGTELREIARRVVWAVEKIASGV